MLRREALDKYELTIGIECHVQFKTKTKMFAAVSNDERGQEPNMVTSPICFGMPGTLPVLNEEAVNLAIKAGTALNAEIAKLSIFDRKHYFYPDLPKGYQITQLDKPIVGRGAIKVPLNDGEFTVGITRAHLEEDAGKSTHPEGADYSLVDLNRAGTPLLEIVSEPDIHSAAQAKAYVQELYLLMRYADVTHGDLQFGNMRFDINISVALKGADKLGKRAEVKNLNSFRAVERAVEYEFERQVDLLERGQTIVQETRGWNDAAQKTFSQRSKEEAMDYRYFPEPDLPPVVLTDEKIAEVRASMSKLPGELRKMLSSLGVNKQDAETLLLRDAMTSSSYVPVLLKVGVVGGKDAAKFAVNFMVNRDMAQSDEENIGELPSADKFVSVYQLRSEDKLSSNNADALLAELRKNPEVGVMELADKLGYLQENDTSVLQQIVKDVLSDPASQKAIADIKAGNPKAVGFLVGQVMKKSGGKANPAAVGKLVNEILTSQN